MTRSAKLKWATSTLVLAFSGYSAALAAPPPITVWDLESTYSPGAAPTNTAPWEAHAATGNTCAQDLGVVTQPWPNNIYGPQVSGVAAATQPSPGNSLPLFFRNNSTAAAGMSANVIVGSHQVGLHPGLNCAVIRFKAPYAGIYKLSGEFFGTQGTANHPYLVAVRILDKGTQVASGQVSRIQGIQSWSFPTGQTYLLNAGDSIDLAVDQGGNGFSADTTLVSARVTWIDVLPPATTAGFIAKDFDFERAQGCAIENGSNKLYCWGANVYGQLGTINQVDSNKAVPAQRIENYLAANNLGPFFDIQVGSGNVCGKTVTGKTLCWGSNDNLESGVTGAWTWPLNPPYGLAHLTAQLGNYQPMKLDGRTGCLITQSGDVRCWGQNFVNANSHGGQLGWKNGTFASSAMPMPAVPNVVGARAVAPGGAFTCAIVGPQKKVICFGNTPWGPSVLGGGSSPTLEVHPDNLAQTYVKTANGTDFTGATKVLVAPNDAFACALASNRLYCWGLNATYGGIVGAPINGPGNPPNVVDFAMLMPGPFQGGVSDFAIASNAICAVSGPGSMVFCQGASTSGQLGKPTTSAWRTLYPAYATTNVTYDATPIPGLAGVTKIRGGAAAFCVMKNAGEVWCWGAGGSGQLGDGTGAASSITPVRVIK